LARKKKSVVFVNKEKQFKMVGSVEQLEGLVSCMSENAKLKADKKIQLFSRISSLKNSQSELFG